MWEILIETCIWIRIFWWWVTWLRFPCSLGFLCFIFTVCAFWLGPWSVAGFSFTNFHSETIWNFSTIFSSGRFLLRIQALVIRGFSCAFTPFRSGSFRATTRTWDWFLGGAFGVPSFSLEANELRLGCSWMSVTVKRRRSCINVSFIRSLPFGGYWEGVKSICLLGLILLFC